MTSVQNKNEEFYDYYKQEMVSDPSDIKEILYSYLEVESYDDAKSYFNDLSFYLRKVKTVKFTFGKQKALRAWKEAEEKALEINDSLEDSSEYMAIVGLKLTEIPTISLDVGVYFAGDFTPYQSFSFVFPE